MPTSQDGNAATPPRAAIAAVTSAPAYGIDVGDQDGGAFVGIQFRDGPADAVGRSGDDGYLVF